VDTRLASTLTRSTGEALTGKPGCEWAPLMHQLIEDFKSEKVRQHLSQAIMDELSQERCKPLVLECLGLIFQVLAPVAEKTKGVKEACTTSLILCS